MSSRGGSSVSSGRLQTSVLGINASLDEMMNIGGAFACALVDFEGGMTLGARTRRSDFDIELAASGNTNVVRAKMMVMDALGIAGGIDDMLITLGAQYHLIRPLRRHDGLFLYLAIDRDRGNLGMARHQLSMIEAQLAI